MVGPKFSLCLVSPLLCLILERPKFVFSVSSSVLTFGETLSCLVSPLPPYVEEALVSLPLS